MLRANKNEYTVCARKLKLSHGKHFAFKGQGMMRNGDHNNFENTALSENTTATKMHKCTCNKVFYMVHKENFSDCETEPAFYLLSSSKDFTN